MDLALGGADIPLDDEAVSAPPSADPPAATLLDVPLGPLADVRAITGDVAAAYAGDDACPPAAGGTRRLSSAKTSLAGLTLVNLPGVGAIADVGASITDSRTALVDRPGQGSRVVSTVRTTVGDVRLLGGAAVVEVESPVTLTASSDGSTTTVESTDPVITVTLAGGEVIHVPGDGSVTPIPLDLGLLSVDLRIRAFAPDDTSSGRTAAGTLDAVIAVDLTVRSVAGPLVDLHLGVGEMSATATAPTGGVDCVPPAPSPDPDGDGLTDQEEAALGTQPGDPDSDDDGLSDGAEVNTHHTDPLDADTDDGGVNDGPEVSNGSDPTNPGDDLPAVGGDTDGDGLSDAQETVLGTSPTNADTDTDGLTDGAEVHTHHTDPLDADTDNGGVKDGPEVDNGTAPLNGADDAPGAPGSTNGPDPDGDGLSTSTETQLGTNPQQPDTDGDGLTDGQEVNGPMVAYPACRTDPKRADTDRDGLKDGAEKRGVRIRQKVVTQARPQGKRIGLVRTNPCAKDTDRDGLKDKREIRGAKLGQRVITGQGSYVLGLRRSNPLKADTDRDGVKDKAEVTGSRNKRHSRHKSDPAHYDTDRGGNNDGRELSEGADPCNAGSYPARPRFGALGIG